MAGVLEAGAGHVRDLARAGLPEVALRPLGRSAQLAMGRAVARAVRHYGDDREVVGLLLLPFLIMATAIGISQSVRPLHLPIPVASHEDLAPERPRDVTAPRLALPRAAAPTTIAPVTEFPEMLAARPVRPEIALAAPDAGMPIIGEAVSPPQIPEVESRSAIPEIDAGETESRPPIPEIAVREAEPEVAGGKGICVADAGRAKTSRDGASPPTEPRAFGVRLALAARTQLDDFVIYNDKYRRISYPMGDVAPLFGVCTDVIVRAYRALGIDLQALVHEARVGGGDTSIDHRRTEVLRRFFARRGTALPVTDFAEDYRPGDIVTYYRPQNRRSRSHIAIVSDVIAPSGRPMIAHNRGWGPQLEDALFVDEITGHYRYQGPARPPATKSAGGPERRGESLAKLN